MSRRPPVAQAAMRAAIARVMVATVVETPRGNVKVPDPDGDVVDGDGARYRMVPRRDVQPERSRSLNATEMRVFLALVALVPLFDKVTDTVANAQIQTVTGLSEREVRRALTALASSGVIDREPGHGRRASTIGFPIPEGGQEPRLEGGNGPRSEGGNGRTGEGSMTPERGVRDPASEYSSESVSESPAVGIIKDALRLLMAQEGVHSEKLAREKWQEPLEALLDKWARPFLLCRNRRITGADLAAIHGNGPLLSELVAFAYDQKEHVS